MPFPAVFDLSTLDGTNGFKLSGTAPDQTLGLALSAVGDVNGDGYADFVVSSLDGTFLVFGRGEGIPASVDQSNFDGSDGVKLISGSSVGSVSGGVDFNNDGFADFVMGSENATVDGKSSAGEAYIIFGKSAGWTAEFDLASLDGSDGFIVQGASANDRLGFAVALEGDINGDAFADVTLTSIVTKLRTH